MVSSFFCNRCRTLTRTWRQRMRHFRQLPRTCCRAWSKNKRLSTSWRKNQTQSAQRTEIWGKESRPGALHRWINVAALHRPMKVTMPGNFRSDSQMLSPHMKKSLCVSSESFQWCQWFVMCCFEQLMFLRFALRFVQALKDLRSQEECDRKKWQRKFEYLQAHCNRR